MAPSLRPKRIAELERELDVLAYQEESLVLDALPKGEPVKRRPSAPPEVVLGVRVAMEVRKFRAA